MTLLPPRPEQETEVRLPRQSDVGGLLDILNDRSFEFGSERDYRKYTELETVRP